MSPDQAAKLFFESLGVAAKVDRNRTVAVIIDNLDETDRKHLIDTAVIFSNLFKTLTQYPNVRVFTFSRTEDDIRNLFARTLKDTNVQHGHLDISDSIEDVALYLRGKLAKVVERYGLNWEVWPSEERMEVLADRASGLFIWAATATQFLEREIGKRREERFLIC